MINDALTRFERDTKNRVIAAFEALPEAEIGALESKLRQIGEEQSDATELAEYFLEELADLWFKVNLGLNDLRDKVAEPAPYENEYVTGR